MPVYASMFTTGLEPLMRECLPRVLRGAEVYEISNGLIIYRFNGKPELLKRLTMCTNTYMVLLRMRNVSFKTLVRKASVSAADAFVYRVRPGETYRIRFQKNGKLERVDDSLRSQAEQIVRHKARLNVNRETPDWEFWYILRSEGLAFYGMLVNRREATERELDKGELRPELAQSMYLYSGATGRHSVLDPFAGHGSIPAQALKARRSAPVYAFDADAESVRRLRRRFAREIDAGVAYVEREDAQSLAALRDSSIDRIITDPPWGDYAEIDESALTTLYYNFMLQARRVLKHDGVLVMLTGAKAIAQHVAKLAGFINQGRMDVLVNGKKAMIARFTLGTEARQEKRAARFNGENE